MRTNGMVLALALVSACAPAASPSIDAMRTEARALVAADRPHASRVYSHVRRAATRAGDHLARVEADLFFAGGDPAWVDVLAPDLREDAYGRLMDLERGSTVVTVLYTLGIVVMAGALGAAVSGLVLMSSGWDRQTADTMLGICGAVGAAGAGTLIAGFVLDFDSAEQRHQWVESLRPPGALW